ncbi:AMP-binding protein, partial [Herbivorax sp. ANBcel31]|uniref:AMP-binding protein n=1 Tax=Herbivorax sp. ANBcel31 TaxID=3069754 RepID=UPI0027B3A91F
IREKGVEPDSIVGIMVDPSIEMTVGVLGILKAGGAYLPIDPEYPQSRIDYMLEDSKTSILLTQEHLIEKVEFEGEIIDLQNTDIYTGGHENLDKVNTPNNLAYVIYTSGSTGNPKGVMVENRSLVNLANWHIKYYDVKHSDRSTKYAGFGFDASVWEVFPYIISGASIYVINEEIRIDCKKLNTYYEKNRISISFLPTQICEEFMKLDNSSLRVLLTGGDKLKNYIKSRYQLVNNYGPTENAVVTSSYLVKNGMWDNIPIGKPIQNTQVYILDKNNKLA